MSYRPLSEMEAPMHMQPGDRSRIRGRTIEPTDRVGEVVGTRPVSALLSPVHDPDAQPRPLPFPGSWRASPARSGVATR
jgi:hypothetical protein